MDMPEFLMAYLILDELYNLLLKQRCKYICMCLTLVFQLDSLFVLVCPAPRFRPLGVSLLTNII